MIKELIGKVVNRESLTYEEMGCAMNEISRTNAKIALEILRGKKCPAKDIVCLNAAAALVVGGISKSIGEGIKIAEESIDSGNALQKLELLKEYTQER